MEEDIKLLIKNMWIDIRETQNDLDDAFGDEYYIASVSSRLYCLQQYVNKLQALLSSDKQYEC